MKAAVISAAKPRLNIGAFSFSGAIRPGAQIRKNTKSVPRRSAAPIARNEGTIRPFARNSA